MYTTIFLKGLGIGMTVSAVIGPIAIMLIRRTLAQGHVVGIAIGLGAALGDAFYGLVAGLGLSAISNLFLAHKTLFSCVSGVFLLYLGTKIFSDKSLPQTATVQSKGLLGITISTFLLTLGNPVTILSFSAIFASINLQIDQTGFLAPLLLVGGVFLGALFWNSMLACILTLFRSKITQEVLITINKCSEALIIGFGTFSLISAFLR